MLSGRFAQVAAFTLVLTWLVPLAGSSSNPGVDKIAARVIDETANGGSTEALVVLNEQADLSPAARLHSKLEKGRFVVNALREVADRSQAPLRNYLQQRNISYQSFFIVNMIKVTGNQSLIRDLAARGDVARIDANPHVRTLIPAYSRVAADAASGIEWNITRVQAPQVWGLGFKGEGRVVAGADTGVQWDHPAIKNQYRGWDGSKVNHDYNWHDATSDHSPSPIDPNSHGTFTVSEMVGDDGQGNQIGVAPKAQWIACRNMDANGTGSPASYSECFEFLIAPYPIGGGKGDPDLSPDSINNSWICPPSEGCSADTLKAVVKAVRAAGIFPSMAAGNSGPGCSTIDTPPATYGAAVTVGATTFEEDIASFSSRGPAVDGSDTRRKPDLSAPGEDIRGAVPGNGYSSGWSGTSMAAPHVAGGVALLWQAKPALIGDIAGSELAFTSTARHKKTTQDCGGRSGQKIPNNTFGYGELRLYRAVTH
jgi:serine protease AprX